MTLKILVIEDDADKFRGIVGFLNSQFESLECHQARSLNSGLRRLEGSVKFELLLLDMSLPTFDVGRRQSAGGSPQALGGEDVLDVIDADGISIPTILVTRYGRFWDGSRTIELSDIDKEFSKKYSWYVGFVQYSATNETWKKPLLDLIVDKFPREPRKRK